MLKTIKYGVYVFNGPAPHDLQGLAPVAEVLACLDERGREVSREENGIKTLSSYDESGLLIEERTDYGGTVTIRHYEYDPEGSLFHIRTEGLRLTHRYGVPLLPNGSLDTAHIWEIVWKVPVGEIQDEWISWEEDGKLRVTEYVTKIDNKAIATFYRHERFLDENVAEVKYIDSKGEEVLSTIEDVQKTEYDVDVNGVWTHRREIGGSGEVISEIVRVIDYGIS